MKKKLLKNDITDTVNQDIIFKFIIILKNLLKKIKTDKNITVNTNNIKYIKLIIKNFNIILIY